MPKRFTDTDKWKKPFIRSLETPYKLLWFYILDDCDHAGIWQVDFAVAEIRIGCKVSENAAKQFFAEKIQVINGGSKWFIRDFIFFQYGELSEKNRLHLSVINILKRNGIDVNKPLISPLEGVKDKDKDKEQDKDRDNGVKESLKTIRGEFTENAEETILGNMIWFNNICMNTHSDEKKARDALRMYHLWLSENDKYPKKRKSVFDGFEKWLRNEKKFYGTHKQASSGGGEKLGTSAARIKAARDF